MALQRVREMLHDVAPGFHVLADFRGLESMDPAAASHIAKMMDALAEKKVASVTRVMPDPHKDIGLNILSQFHYGANVKIATFETLADALQNIAANVDFSSPEFLAALLPAFIASASVMYLPFFVVP
jgi:hypothetical protein